MRARLLLADHQKILTDGLSKLLEQFYDIAATAANGYELIALGKEVNPDVIVTEISMPLLNGLDALRVLRKSGVRARFVVLTMHLDMGLAVQAFRAGAARHPDEDRARLSRRQREVLQLVAEGKTMKEVATVLGISTRTAESYK